MSAYRPGELQRLRTLVAEKKPRAGTRTWGDDRCDECCNGDRCDDPTHIDRTHCPHCLSTGYALWLPQFQAVRLGCPDLDPEWPNILGEPRGPTLCVLYPNCACGAADAKRPAQGEPDGR